MKCLSLQRLSAVPALQMTHTGSGEEIPSPYANCIDVWRILRVLEPHHMNHLGPNGAVRTTFEEHNLFTGFYVFKPCVDSLSDAPFSLLMTGKNSGKWATIKTSNIQHIRTRKPHRTPGATRTQALPYSRGPTRGGFNGAAVLRRQVIEVQFDAVFNDPPFGAVFVPCDGTKPRLCGGAQSEQLARIVPYAFRFTLLAESFRRASPSLLRRVHRLIMSYHKIIDLCYHKCYSLFMKAIGYVRVSTEKQADFGVSLEAQSEKVRAMAVVQGAELAEVIIDAGESAKSLNRPGMARLLSLVDAGAPWMPSSLRSWTGSPEA